MSELRNHPLNGINLETLLGELVRHYGWETLAEQININCFKSYPSFQSSIKYLRKTTWAREKLEAFYLYKFLQHPRPTDEQHQQPPRNRLVDLERLSDCPAEFAAGDPEFFDDPQSGPVYPSKRSIERSKLGAKKKTELVSPTKREDAGPWAKWDK